MSDLALYSVRFSICELGLVSDLALYSVTFSFCEFTLPSNGFSIHECILLVSELASVNAFCTVSDFAYFNAL